MIDYRFTMDFSLENSVTLGNHQCIDYIIKKFQIPEVYIEIGIFEGNTLFPFADEFCKFKPNIRIYGIDPHFGSIDMDESGDEVNKNFMHNLNICPNKENITFLRKKSFDGLIDLLQNNVRADLIFIDGDHRASTVIEDLVLSWKCLKIGGVILCDDVIGWKYENEKENLCAAHMSPKVAVDSFIQCNWNKLELIPMPISTKIAFTKLKE